MAKSSKTPQVKPRADVPLVGLGAARQMVTRALQANRFPQGLLLTGADGIGKSRFAEWIASALVCESSEEKPCGECRSCRLSKRLGHPDIHWLFPHGSPGGGSLDRQIDAVETKIQEELDARRADALHPGAPPEALHYLASVQRLRRLVQRTSSEGSAKVFILAEADRLVIADDGAGPAVNALLKTLEEPPGNTHFLLTSARPHRLPDTVGSRLSRLHLPPLPFEDVRAVLNAAWQGDGDMDEAARYARGSVTRARQRLDPEWMELRLQSTEMVRLALLATPEERYAAVRAQGFKGARAGFTALLSEMESVFVEVAEALSSDATESPPEIRDLLGSLSKTVTSGQAVDGAFRAATCLGDAANNASPMLVLHRLLANV